MGGYQIFITGWKSPPCYFSRLLLCVSPLKFCICILQSLHFNLAPSTENQCFIEKRTKERSLTSLNQLQASYPYPKMSTSSALFLYSSSLAQCHVQNRWPVSAAKYTLHSLHTLQSLLFNSIPLRVRGRLHPRITMPVQRCGCSSLIYQSSLNQCVAEQ